MGLVPPISQRKIPLPFPNSHEITPSTNTTTTTTTTTYQPILSSSSLYRSFSSGLEHQMSNIILSSTYPNIPTSTTTTSFNFQTQMQEKYIVGSSSTSATPIGNPVQYNYIPVKDNNILVFGSDQGRSCSSSSDGSCNQISCGGCRELRQEEQIMGFHHQGYNLNMANFNDFDEQLMINYDNHQNLWGQKSNGYFGESSLEYCGLGDDHIKQLLSSSTNSSNIINSNNNNYNYGSNNIDDNKTQDKVMYF